MLSYHNWHHFNLDHQYQYDNHRVITHDDDNDDDSDDDINDDDDFDSVRDYDDNFDDDASVHHNTSYDGWHDDML